MRKLVSKHEKEKSKRRNQIILGVILVFVMVVSTLGFGFGGRGGSSNKITYNGVEFVEQNSLWTAGNFVFKYNPNQVSDIGFIMKTIYDYQGLPLYIYSEHPEAELEIYTNLNQIAQRVQRACIEGEECIGDLPMKTCSDNFIIIKENINNSITQEDNCIYIIGAEEELVKLADQFLFKILGIRG